MGEKDLTEKILEDHNDVFADIVNVLLFNGTRRIEEEHLENTKIHSQYKASKKWKGQERDVAKFWNKHNVHIAMVGIENQTEPEKQMPLRIFGYEGASYREQLGNKILYPVITIVLYFGTKERWNYEKKLKGLIEIPDFLDKFVNDIKVNVVEVAWLPDEIIEKFTSDFKAVARFFVEKRKNQDYKPDDKTPLKHLEDVLRLFSAITGDNRYEKILLDDGKEVHNMCEVAERLEQIGRAEGRTEGKSEVIGSMLSKGYSVEEIANITDLDINFVREVEAKNK